mmetsp:Transcript_20240/g.40372  ORF Transcript_20240/g.40372 Transcript_20240/m.40372 type:complete len:354 (-) Transcript_20240:137-1198(-)
MALNTCMRTASRLPAHQWQRAFATAPDGLRAATLSHLTKLSVPVVAAPMFIVSNVDLVIAQCCAGVVGSTPALNARPQSELRSWLDQICTALEKHDHRPEVRDGVLPKAAPYAINQIVHRSNDRLMEDMAVCAEFQTPIIITSLGAREDVNDAVQSWGGIVLHDVISNAFAKKAVQKGANGLIAVATGAGGHAGVASPFALVQEIREWFDGPLVLSGSISTGGAVVAARAVGADLAYIGSAFIATEEANATDDYKRAIVECNSTDIVNSSLFTGVAGNYLRPSIVAAGLDPENLPEGDVTKMNFGSGDTNLAKAWKDIWGCGQGIGSIDGVVSTSDFVGRLCDEYTETIDRLK